MESGTETINISTDSFLPGSSKKRRAEDVSGMEIDPSTGIEGQSTKKEPRPKKFKSEGKVNIRKIAVPPHRLDLFSIIL